MTTFHNAGGTELEEKLGKKTVDIAKASNISHVIFSYNFFVFLLFFFIFFLIYIYI